MQNHNVPPITFIGIGAPKCATSWLFECLDEHPDICGAKPKETNYFTTGSEIEAPYANYFSHCDHRTHRGEFSTHYLYDDGAPARIHATYPQAKLILCVRHPIERARSHFLHDKKRERRTAPTFKAQFYNGPKSIFIQSKYAAYLERWLNFFPRKQILIVLYRDIQLNPEQVVKDTYRFLGVNDTFMPPSLKKRVNDTKRLHIRIPGLENFVLTTRHIVRSTPILKQTTMPIIRALNIHRIGKSILRWNVVRDAQHTVHHAVSDTAAISPKLSEELAAYYAHDIIAMERLLKRDLNFWKEPVSQYS